ncbi:MAG: flagellar biosynthesis regulator FlaF [Pseudomonadota bacterium]
MLDSSTQARNAYATTQSAAATPRALEYQVFSQITARLSKAKDAETPKVFTQLAEALHDNVKLWTILAADAAGDGNQLAPTLRAQIVSLAGFVRGETKRVLEKQTGPETLIDLNTSMMRGLRGAAENGS